MLTRDAILSAKDLRAETIVVPEWGGDVVIRELTGEQRSEYYGLLRSLCADESPVGQKLERAILIACVVRDEAGNRLFADVDIPNLAQKNGRAIDRIYFAAARLCGLRSSDIEELIKNSESSRNDGSGCASRTNIESPSVSSSKS